MVREGLDAEVEWQWGDGGALVAAPHSVYRQTVRGVYEPGVGVCLTDIYLIHFVSLNGPAQPTHTVVPVGA